MEQLAGGKLNLTAKMAGGASMFSTTVAANIGLQNIEACEQLLGEIGNSDRWPNTVAANKGRRMSLDTANGKVVIEIVGQDPIEL